jgi:hypothetical protein
VRQTLLAFLEQELQDVVSGKRASSINCSGSELAAFAAALECDPVDFPSGWEDICPNWAENRSV